MTNNSSSTWQQEASKFWPRTVVFSLLLRTQEFSLIFLSLLGFGNWRRLGECYRFAGLKTVARLVMMLASG